MDQVVQKFLVDVVDIISQIDEELQGLAYEDYKNDRNKMIIVVQCFDSMINSVTTISPVIRLLHTEIPWDEIESYRRLFEHDDNGIDEEAIWKISKIKLRTLKKNFLLLLNM